MAKKKEISNRGADIQRASWIGIVGNAILAILKITVGIIAGSAAVVADGIDSASDILGSLITYYATTVSETPPDKKHPWGHKRIEAIATKVISFFILIAGFQLVISTASMLWEGEVRELPGKAALVVTVISILAKAAIASYKFRVADRTQSSMVRADATNMKNDIFLSLAVLIGLGLTYLTKLPIIDTIVGIVLGIWIIKSGVELSLETNDELMDSIEDQDLMYKKLFTIVEKTPGANNPHKVRIRKLNNLFDINLDIEVDGDLSVIEGHNIAQTVEKNIRDEFMHVYDVLIHIEPLGNIEEEQFGLSQSDFENKTE